MEEEGKGEGDSLGHLLLNLAVELLVLALPELGDDDEVLDEAFKPIKPHTSQLLRVCLLNRDADDVDQGFHEGLLGACRLCLSFLLRTCWSLVLSLASHTIDNTESGGAEAETV